VRIFHTRAGLTYFGGSFSILVFWLIVAWLVWRFWLRDLWQ
jgi:hypothetical protein